MNSLAAESDIVFPSTLFIQRFGGGQPTPRICSCRFVQPPAPDFPERMNSRVTFTLLPPDFVCFTDEILVRLPPDCLPHVPGARWRTPGACSLVLFPRGLG